MLARFKAASTKQRYDSRSEVTPPAHRKEDGPAGVRSMPVGYPCAKRERACGQATCLAAAVFGPRLLLLGKGSFDIVLLAKTAWRHASPGAHVRSENCRATCAPPRILLSFNEMSNHEGQVGKRKGGSSGATPRTTSSAQRAHPDHARGARRRRSTSTARGLCRTPRSRRPCAPAERRAGARVVGLGCGKNRASAPAFACHRNGCLGHDRRQLFGARIFCGDDRHISQTVPPPCPSAGAFRGRVDGP